MPTFDTAAIATHGAFTTLNWSYTLPSYTNPILMFSLSFFTSGAISTVKYNDVLATEAITWGDTFDPYSSLYYMLAASLPSPGTYTAQVVITVAAGACFAAYAVSDLAQQAPLATIGHNVFDLTNISTSLTPPHESILVDNLLRVMFNSTSALPDPSLTGDQDGERYEANVVFFTDHALSGHGSHIAVTDGTSEAMAWSWSPLTHRAVHALAAFARSSETFNESLGLSGSAALDLAGILALSPILSLVGQASLSLSGYLVAQAVAPLTAQGALSQNGVLVANGTTTLTAEVTQALLGGLILESLVSLDANAAEVLAGPASLQEDVPLSVLVQNPVLSNLIAQGVVSLASDVSHSQIAQAVKNAVAALEVNVLLTLIDSLGDIEASLILGAEVSLTPSAQATMQALVNLVSDIVKASTGTLVVQEQTTLTSDAVTNFVSSFEELLASLTLSTQVTVSSSTQAHLEAALIFALQATLTNQAQAVMEALMDLGVEAALAQSASLALTEAMTLQVAGDMLAAGTVVSGTIGTILQRVGEALLMPGPTQETLDQ